MEERFNTFSGTSPRYLTRLADLPQLTDEEKRRLTGVEETFKFRSNDYYLSLVNWDDPNDPIRRIAIPNRDELLAQSEWSLDASGESDYTVAPGLQHKYRQTALLLVNDNCGGYCRFCFRKRLFIESTDEAGRNISAGLEYIKKHPEISNVLLTGGDSLLLPTPRLEAVLRQIREIDHVKLIRLGSKMPAFNPFRITEDPELLEVLSRYSNGEKRIYVMAHFNHPRELTPQAKQAMELLQEAGVITINQTPLVRGVNDDPDVLADLFETLSHMGVPPYYVFQCRPTKGNETFSVPIEEGYEIFEEASSRISGLAKRARYVMSHRTGKVEVVGMDNNRIFMKYHREPAPESAPSIMTFPRNPEAAWLDDYSRHASLQEIPDVLRVG